LAFFGMANRLEISDAEWEAIHPILVAKKGTRVVPEENCRAFLTAAL
jgi:hypothetical protein